MVSDLPAASLGLCFIRIINFASLTLANELHSYIKLALRQVPIRVRWESLLT